MQIISLVMAASVEGIASSHCANLLLLSTTSASCLWLESTMQRLPAKVLFFSIWKNSLQQVKNILHWTHAGAKAGLRNLTDCAW